MTVDVTDPAGNKVSSQPLALTIDTTAPRVAVSSTDMGIKDAEVLKAGDLRKPIVLLTDEAVMLDDEASVNDFVLTKNIGGKNLL